MRNTEMLDLQPVYLAFFLLYLKASVICRLYPDLLAQHLLAEIGMLKLLNLEP
jgi:hypothetical protein